ncbi:MAG: hypothetical protein PHS44_06105 [Candidatus Dojkabacteria bacterium]|jgi:hypothetical protein|nr:hypothetical protein [Candidatus Dojkabacteria bacterium]
MNKTVVIILIVAALLLCCCLVSGIGVFLFVNSDTTDNGNNSTNTSSSTNTSFSRSSSTTTTVITDELPYTNYEHGFSLVFPESWEGYKVDKTSGTGMGFEAYYEFKLKSSTSGEVSLFTMTVYSKDDWDPMMEELGLEYKLGESTEYVYTFAQMNGIAPNDLQEAFSDIDDIKDSFKIIDNTYETK